jgi:hypothetical protein
VPRDPVDELVSDACWAFKYRIDRYERSLEDDEIAPKPVIEGIAIWAAVGALRKYDIPVTRMSVQRVITAMADAL